MAAALAALLALSGCAAQKRYEAQFMDVFDTASAVVGYARSEADFTRRVSALHEDLRRYHRLFDIYNRYDGLNNLKTVNDNAGKAPVKVEPEVMRLLALCVEMEEKTGGKVNAAFGSVLEIWHDYREAGIADAAEARLPPMEALREAERHTDISRMRLDFEASTVYLEDAGMRLDVGAVAKGFAAQLACESARERGEASLLLSLGGNVCAVGKRADGTDFRISIQNPLSDSGENIKTGLPLSDASLVTSGDYQRYYTVNGARYHHIIDPLTLMPAGYIHAVTVYSPDSGVADALSTALFNMSVEDGKSLLRAFPGAEALWVEPDGSVRQTDGFPAAG